MRLSSRKKALVRLDEDGTATIETTMRRSGSLEPLESMCGDAMPFPRRGGTRVLRGIIGPGNPRPGEIACRHM